MATTSKDVKEAKVFECTNIQVTLLVTVAFVPGCLVLQWPLYLKRRDLPGLLET